MRILLINVPHTAIGSRIPDDHLPPLGLLSVGGPLSDDGHEVALIDADMENLSDLQILERAQKAGPDLIMFGHSGSSSGHPVIKRIGSQMAKTLPDVLIIYGGVYPTYYWREILEEEPYVTAIVKGEGEETTRQLVRSLESSSPLNKVDGIAFRDAGQIQATKPAIVVKKLDEYRVGWELIDHKKYSYWGGMRAVVVQFSRGCPHLCTYCGQRGFWSRWRHRDPVKFAKEIARLHRDEGVELFNFADENPTVSKKSWKLFLETLIAENVDVTLVGSTRADDIVRDADILHLYKKAGWIRFLLGLENTDEATLAKIKKGTTTSIDREAIRLLRQHNIISMATWVVGFEEETDKSHWLGLKQLLSYDPDQIQMLYVTPHRWTPYFKEAESRQIVQTDKRFWDYKHQVLATKFMTPFRTLLWFKMTEAILQGRPKALWRTYLHPDQDVRHAMRWYSQMGRRVWPFEIFNFFARRRVKNGPTVAQLWGRTQEKEEFSMQTKNNAKDKFRLDDVA